ncbi:DUF1244 domain-containing protein, partial [Pseudomonas mandelii]|uniref:DUF1244 domain-containing protein n=1 Tax=Pseudomonas mandelii TaxID=75612 RepID=UPI003D07A3C7
MAFNMRNRSLLSLMHHTTRELNYLLDLSRDLKRAKYTGTERPHREVVYGMPYAEWKAQYQQEANAEQQAA